MNNITNNILDKIKTGEVTMRPRWHFVLKAFLLISGILLAALIAIYLLSFVLFTLHKSGVLFAPQFGWHGVMLFVIASPWMLIGILGIFLLVLYLLVSKYSFSYQKPLVYSIVGVVLFVIAVASMIQYYGIHDRVQAFSDRSNLPGLRQLYADPADRRPAGVARGTINTLTEVGFTLETDRAEILHITVTTQTKRPRLRGLQTGDQVIVFGERVDSSITAFGVKSVQGRQFGIPSRNNNGMPPRPNK